MVIERVSELLLGDLGLGEVGPERGGLSVVSLSLVRCVIEERACTVSEGKPSPVPSDQCQMVPPNITSLVIE